MIGPDLRTPLPTLVKNATEKNHLDLEAAIAPVWERLQEPGVYARLLQSFHGFFAPVEKSIDRNFPVTALPDIPQRRKASWILSDLAALGVPETPPASTFLPDINNADAAWGALYVLEGSTLGGRHICGIIRKALPDAPLRFFEGYGAETGPRWVAFRAALEAWGEKNDPASVTEAANLTFQNFRLWIKQTL
ncbi:biliverdin-producing heme oxygenase [Flaviaesturariibacter flavus]|uniref:biliverdin-producing heme oxygenase n=1 Tax=Flaviaesturariibacter flavus TaxID=2502780 RepID=UPI001404E3C7|nr:biliverdin-producing heme oxygenase [Flaviaesturariibacter flavus]